MVKLGPDLYTGSDSYSGYQATGNFTGFTMLHESGTGGAPKYGVVSQMPVVGDIENPLLDHNDTRASTDVTRVGYYKVNTGSGVTLELAASKRAGLYNYTFPSAAASTNVIVDVSHVLPSYRGQGLGQNYLGGNITVIPSSDGSSLRYEGSGSYDNVSRITTSHDLYHEVLTHRNHRGGIEHRNGLSSSAGISISQQSTRHFLALLQPRRTSSRTITPPVSPLLPVSAPYSHSTRRRSPPESESPSYRRPRRAATSMMKYPPMPPCQRWNRMPEEPGMMPSCPRSPQLTRRARRICNSCIAPYTT